MKKIENELIGGFCVYRLCCYFKPWLRAGVDISHFSDSRDISYGGGLVDILGKL